MAKASAQAVAKLLAKEASRGKLTIYAGAGISMGAPTFLPGAWDLAEAIRSALSGEYDFTSVKAGDLLGVADVVGGDSTGKRLLQTTILDVADMTGARPNDAHEGLALMVLEGAATVLETNYDDCIERSVTGERVEVVVEDGDRIDMDLHALLTVHGCAHRRSTMLVTTEDLKNPPLYARAELAARLSQGTVVFLGLGSTADYVQESIKLLLSHVATNRLYVVGKVADQWDESGWATLLPALPEDQRLGIDADAFLRLLAEQYLADMLLSLEDAAKDIWDVAAEEHGVLSLCAKMRQAPIAGLSWLRGAAWPHKSGVPTATAQTTFKGLLAIGTLLGPDAELLVARGPLAAPDGMALADSAVALMLLLVGGRMHGSRAAKEAVARVQEARTRNQVATGVEVVVVCPGSAGSLGPEEVAVPRGVTPQQVLDTARGSVGLMPTSIVAAADSGNILDSASGGRIYLVSST